MSGTSKISAILHKSKLYLKQSSPAILTCLGAIGVVSTSVLAVKATPKACQLLENERYERAYKADDDSQYYQDLMPLEVIQLTWKCYIPAALVGLSTIACIFGANVLSKRNQTSLVSAYALLNQSYQQYRNAAKAVYGEDADEKIKIEAAKNVYVSAAGCYIYDPESESEEILFYDTFCKRYFTSTMSSVINAQYHVNRNFALRGWSDINELYDFLGLEKYRGGDLIGWSADEMLESGLTPWIEFENRLVKMDDGLECYIISTLYEPTVLNPDDY
jgi:hypothetical protein